VCDLTFYPPFVFSSLDLLPEEIFATEETPEYISSDSSLEAEDATQEQRINHQLRRRVRHLEHDLRDITARCQAEHERRMALEALVGGKTSIFDFTLRSLSLTTVPLSQMFPIGTVTESCLEQLNGGCESWSPPTLPSCRHGGPGTKVENGTENSEFDRAVFYF
jgi:hypothetical protein